MHDGSGSVCVKISADDAISKVPFVKSTLFNKLHVQPVKISAYDALA